MRTETKSLRDLKMNITGCPSPQKGKMVSKSGRSRALENTFREEKPQSQIDNENMSGEVEKQGIADATLRLMKMVDYLESAQKDGTANIDADSKGNSDSDDNNKSEPAGSAEEGNNLAKLEVDTSLQSLSRVSTLGSDNEAEHQDPIMEDPLPQMYEDEYEKSFQASKDTLSSAKDFLKELSDNDATEEKSDS